MKRADTVASFLACPAPENFPAGAKSSDSALDHSPLKAIDHSLETTWRSEPDGAAPKSLSIDMKELRKTDSITLTSPQTEEEAPVRMAIRGSHDGRFGSTLLHSRHQNPLYRSISQKLICTFESSRLQPKV